MKKGKPSTGAAGVQVSLEKNRLRINGQPVAMPVSVAKLTKILGGAPRATEPGPMSKALPADLVAMLEDERGNTCAWDALGVFAHCDPGNKKISAIGIVFEPDRLDPRPFLPRQVFRGVFSWNGSAFTAENQFRGLAAYANSLLTNRERGDRRFKMVAMPGFEIDLDVDEKKRQISNLSISVPEDRPAAKPFVVPKGRGVVFKDFNFKLAVLQELMYRRGVLKPRFDVHAWAESADVDIERHGYKVIREVRDIFARYPVTAKQLAGITSLTQDGGDDIFLQIYPFWDGEDETFQIRSAADAALLPRLKKVVLLASDAVLAQFRARGIAASSQ